MAEPIGTASGGAEVRDLITPQVKYAVSSFVLAGLTESQYESVDSIGSAGVRSILRAHFLVPRWVYLTVAGVPEVIDAG